MTMSTEVVRNGRMLRAVPLPKYIHAAWKKAQTVRLEPEWVLLPDTKLPLAPHGFAEPKQVILAAEVASQISANILRGQSRVAEVVEWRQAAMIAMREVFPKFSLKATARLFHRDHTTVLHAIEKHRANPARFAKKIAAINEVLV